MIYIGINMDSETFVIPPLHIVSCMGSADLDRFLLFLLTLLLMQQLNLINNYFLISSEAAINFNIVQYYFCHLQQGWLIVDFDINSTK